MERRIAYELPDPAYEAYTWILQDEHMAGVPTHLSWEGGFFRPPRPQPGEVPMMVQVNGFPYARPQASNLNPFGQVEAPKTVEDLTRWRQEWLPQVDGLVRDLESFDPAAVKAGEWQSVIRDQDRETMRVFSGVHLNTVINGHMAVEAFTTAYVARFGEESRPETVQLLQGFPNLSLERAAALWDLGRMARADAAILAALHSGSEFPASESGKRFGAQFDELLHRFGYTTNIGGAHLPTWQEDRSIPLGIIKTYARLPDGRGPRVGAEQQARARLALEARLSAMEPADSDLLRLLEMAQQYLPNLEDHNLLCDQRVGAATRSRWLVAGRLLQARGAESADDVFYYRRAELLAALDGGDLLPAATVAERRAFIAAVTASPPPPRLGKPAEPGPADGQAKVEPASALAIQGIGAARGVYTGRARIIENLEDAGRLEEGDVLVCRMTSPPWTPLFATIGALVVNTGGMLSHGAVVAREFGIPAVVGTTYATTRIPDGALVTVDGTNGTVIVESG